jgi:hypothetical protein
VTFATPAPFQQIVSSLKKPDPLCKLVELM